MIDTININGSRVSGGPLAPGQSIFNFTYNFDFPYKMTHIRCSLYDFTAAPVFTFHPFFCMFQFVGPGFGALLAKSFFNIGGNSRTEPNAVQFVGTITDQLDTITALDVGEGVTINFEIFTISGFPGANTTFVLNMQVDCELPDNIQAGFPSIVYGGPTV